MNQRQTKNRLDKRPGALIIYCQIVHKCMGYPLKPHLNLSSYLDLT